MKIIDVNGEERECVSALPDSKFAGFMKVEFLSKLRKGYNHSEWYPIEDFITNNPTLKHLTTKAPKIVKDDLGVVTDAEPTTLTDKTKKWEQNIYRGFLIWISRGKGEGQTRKVTGNTQSIIIISKAWETIPNKTSQYVLSNNVHDPQVRGNTLTAVETRKIVDKKPKVR
jgi:hypothetical protein